MRADRLDVRMLSASYARQAVLKGVSLTLRRGEWMAVAGPNGAGKTTLLRAIAGLLPYTGSIRLRGEEVRELDHARRARRVAVVPQAASVQFAFTVHEIVLMGRRPHLGFWRFETPEDHHLAEAALRSVGLWRLRDRPVQELSSGEFQKVLIARAVCQGSEVLLMDEPTAHLDLKAQVEVLETVRALREKGTAVLSVFHDLNLALRYAGSVLLLRNGRVLASGPPEEVIIPPLLREAYGVECAVGRVGGVPVVTVPTNPARCAPA